MSSNAVKVDHALHEVLLQESEQAWRDPLTALTLWDGARTIRPELFQCEVRGDWWGIIEQLGVTLFVTREYEHLVLGLSVLEGKPVQSFLSLPHPSGLVVNRKTDELVVASTRNPNQLFHFRPTAGSIVRSDIDGPKSQNSPLVPVRSSFVPGCTYMHDLAYIGDQLMINAVGLNAIAELTANGEVNPVWWPRCVEQSGKLNSSANYIQLNSIAAGDSLENSFFSASCDEIGDIRPGNPEFAVDKRGVIFSGKTREAVCRGLTRPHSARLHEGKLWVDNSGYGELVIAQNGGYTPATRLPGWTRGLDFVGRFAFVGTSRVIPRFRRYAPGLNVDDSRCGVHIVDTSSGEVLASLLWPYGNQIFAIDHIDSAATVGFPFLVGETAATEQERSLMYAYKLTR